MNLISSLRLKPRSMIVAIMAATLLTALAAGNVLAEDDSMMMAGDGQTLSSQPPEVQILFVAHYGDDAEAQWVREHNEAIGYSMMDDGMMDDGMMDDGMMDDDMMDDDSMMDDDMMDDDSMMDDDMMDPRKHPLYDKVFHVAYHRSGDLELARQITEDVIMRGTIEDFLAGRDMGVIYGVVGMMMDDDDMMDDDMMMDDDN